MPDIKDILDALDKDDRKLYAQTRTRMRTAYLMALSDIVGMHDHNESDDEVLDWIDVKIAIMFDRAGRFDNSITILPDVSKLEQEIVEQGKALISKSVSMIEDKKEIKLENVWPS